jgi:hypothetical protein
VVGQRAGLGADVWLTPDHGSMTLVDRDNARVLGIGFYASGRYEVIQRDD